MLRLPSDPSHGCQLPYNYCFRTIVIQVVHKELLVILHRCAPRFPLNRRTNILKNQIYTAAKIEERSSSSPADVVRLNLNLIIDPASSSGFFSLVTPLPDVVVVFILFCWD